MNLGGSSVVVIGGSSGIGLATARLAAQAGMEVTIVGRDADRLARARADIGVVATAQLDMRAEAEVQSFFHDLGTVDHIVVTASDAVGGAFLDLEVARGRAFMDSKFWGPYIVARYGVPVLSRKGSLTLFSGAAGERASPGFALGSAINAAVDALVRSLAVELAPIRVNSVSPGIVDTPVWNALPGVDAAAVFQDTAARVPAGRVARAEEIASAVLHVLDNEYLTGVSLRVDGGYALV